MVRQLTADAKRLLPDRLLLADGSSLPQIPWASIRDDPTVTEPGWNFLCGRQAIWPTDGKRWVVDQARSKSLEWRQVMARWAGRETQASWYVCQCVAKGYLADVEEFR